MVTLWTKFKNSKYFEEKRRFLLFTFVLFLVLFLAAYLFSIAYARYEVESKINANIEKALYIFGTDEIDFNLEPDGIVPSDEPYVYKFSVSNYNDNYDSDVDIYYNLNIRTTTNLPITIKLYKDELYTDSSATNLFSSGSVTKNDSDGAWYHVYSCSDTYEMYYKNKTTHVYTIVIDFPVEYSKDTTYENYIESIEVNINSKQM